MKSVSISKILGFAIAGGVLIAGIGASAAIIDIKSPLFKTENQQQKDLRKKLRDLYTQLKTSDQTCGNEQGLETSICKDNTLAFNKPACLAARKTAIINGVCKTAINPDQCLNDRLISSSLDDNLCIGSKNIREQIAATVAEAQAKGMSADDLNQILAEIQDEFAVAAIGDTNAGTIPNITPMPIADPQSGYNGG